MNAARDDMRRLQATLEEIREAGLYKEERIITSPQRANIDVAANGGTREVLNFCANNYLGLADHPEVIAAALQYHPFLRSPTQNPEFPHGPHACWSQEEEEQYWAYRVKLQIYQTMFSSSPYLVQIISNCFKSTAVFRHKFSKSLAEWTHST